MKLIARGVFIIFLLLSVGNVLAGAQLSAQEQKRLSVKVDNVTLKEAIEVIKKEGNYSFLIRNNEIDLSKKVSVNVSNGTIYDVMGKLLAGTDISYEVKENRVIMYYAMAPKNELAKTFVLKGRVIDPAGEGVIGANVKVLNSTEGTITDMDGNFSLTVALNARLSVSYIGYATQEVVVKDQRPMNITLREDTRLIDEVVVVGYGVQKKANLTGAVSMVKMEDVLGNRPVTSVSTALKGAMPGLQVTSSSGRPGEEMSFNIRGVNNLDGSGKPLILVDNVEMDINMLDPNDIESVTVLKDAASSAIYGARAAFGVVLVTTKKGDGATKLSINYSNNFSFSRPANMPHKATPLQTVQAYKDMGMITRSGTDNGQDVATWLELLKEYNADPSAYPDGYAMVNNARYSLAETDLLSDMMETGFQQTHNLSVGGGTKDISYRFSFGMVNENGVLVSDKDSYKRYNVSSYLRSDVFSWITPELDIKYTNSKSSLPETGMSYGIWGAAVAFPSYFPTGTLNVNDEELPINTPRNVIDLAYPTTKQNNNIRIFGKVTITPFKNVKLIGEYTFNHKTQEKTKFDKKFNYAHGGQFVSQTSVENSKYEYDNGVTDYNALNFYGNYSNSWGKHDVTVMGGFNQESSDYRYAYMSRTDMINEDLPSISQATGDYYAKDEFKRFTVRGLFYRINYSFAGKYLIETNGRYDGSSKFPKDSRFGFFPSVSAGWRVSEEAFMKPLKSVVSNLKLRGSWGNIGNQSISPYAFVPGMESARANWTVNGIKVTTLKPPSLVSNSFTWEKVTTVDVGFDLGLLDHRLNVVFDWYRRDTKGMLAPGFEMPAVLGASAPLQNTADLRSKGWEISVDWNDKIGNVRYNIGFNLYDARTKVTKYNNETGLFGKDKNDKETYRVGMELGEIWGYVTDRLYTTDDFDDAGNLKEGIPKVEGYNPNPGDILYKDLDENGIINGGISTVSNPGDRKVIGNNTRRYQYGIRGGASWNGFAFSFLLQGVGKRDLWRMNELFYPFKDEWSTLYDSQLDYWTPEHTASYFPRLYEKAAGNTAANQRTQTRYLLDGSYLSIRNITFSYNFPVKWISKIGVNNLSVFFSGENLYTFDHLPKGLDPERTVTDDLGQRGFTYPYMRQYSFGVNIAF
ncbi:TonB-dependent receptor [Bacteroides cellulosilyticus]|uniref:TonB-dependent receptor n=1 Tax=Bacteroides cellulosilyticus TaxID=246787 RepID=UPI003561460B